MDEQLTNESDPASTEAKPSAQIPAGAIAIIPLRNSVLFPYTVMPLTIGRPSVLLAVEEAVRQQLPIGVVLQRGLVLPVGGIKGKVLAAKRAGLSCVLLPELNRKDLEEIPPQARRGSCFEFLTTVDEALRLGLEPDSAAGLPAIQRLAS